MTSPAVQRQPEKDCEQKALSIHEYRSATEEYIRTVSMLNHSRSLLSKAEFDGILIFIEKARARTEAAYLALDQHIAEHGCSY